MMVYIVCSTNYGLSKKFEVDKVFINEEDARVYKNKIMASNKPTIDGVLDYAWVKAVKLDDNELDLLLLQNKYKFIGAFIYKHSLSEFCIDSIIHILSRNKDIYGRNMKSESVEIGIKSYLLYPDSKQGIFFKTICSDYGAEGYLKELEEQMNKLKQLKIELIPGFIPKHE